MSRRACIPRRQQIAHKRSQPMAERTSSNKRLKSGFVDHGRFGLKEGLVEKLEQKYVGKLKQKYSMKEILKFKETIAEQKHQINELLEEPDDDEGHIYLMYMESLQYKNGSQIFQYKDMIIDNPFKISVTGKDSPNNKNHQTNNAHKLIIAYRSATKFEKYKECKELFKKKYSDSNTLGGTDWFISDIWTAKTDLEKIISDTCGVSVDMISMN